MVAALAAVSFLGTSCSKHENVPLGSGFIEATEVTISAEVAGTIEEIYVEEGDEIAVGQPIVLIDTTALALELEQARAEQAAIRTHIQSAEIKLKQAILDSSLAAKEFTRISNLIASGSVREQQYDEVKTHYRQVSLSTAAARAALAAARADLERMRSQIDLIRERLSDCKPRSPMTGTVVTRYVQRGELVTPGKPLVRIANLDTVWVKFYLNPDDLGKVKLGAKAEVDAEIPETKPLMGKVTWISPKAEFTPKNVQTKEARADLVYAVKVTIPNPERKLKIGMPVMVRIQ